MDRGSIVLVVEKTKDERVIALSSDAGDSNIFRRQVL
jgi:hypothetical protein